MYKFIFVLLVVVGMATASNAQEKQITVPGKISTAGLPSS